MTIVVASLGQWKYAKKDYMNAPGRQKDGLALSLMEEVVELQNEVEVDPGEAKVEELGRVEVELETAKVEELGRVEVELETAKVEARDR
jgi:hypothetical protein